MDDNDGIKKVDNSDEKKETKEDEINTKDNLSNNEKVNKDNIKKCKILENPKTKTSNKNNEKETGNKRLNNFINSSNSNIPHNRYYSTIASNHFFKNFVKKTNYNKNKDHSNENIEQNDFDVDYRLNENRPLSFTSRNDFYSHKGLDYILGNSNPNNIYNKNYIDNKKSGYNYKNYVRGKRNNYVNKNIFFNNQMEKISNFNDFNYNFFEQKNEIKNTETQLNQNYIQMNKIIKLDDLDSKILNTANNILSNLGYKNIILQNDLLLKNLFH